MLYKHINMEIIGTASINSKLLERKARAVVIIQGRPFLKEFIERVVKEGNIFLA